jgi:hypothetical protein
MPVLEMEPTVGLIDHETAVFEAFVTDALNCWTPEDCKATPDGRSEIAGEMPGSL